jgi:hypothetical protein
VPCPALLIPMLWSTGERNGQGKLPYLGGQTSRRLTVRVVVQGFITCPVRSQA